MRTWLAEASRPTLSLLVGGYSGALIVLGLIVVREERWWVALLAGVVVGALAGVVVGPVLHRQYDPVRGAVGPLAAPTRRAALRAASRGPVPEDDDARAAALELVEHQLAEYRRQWWLTWTVLPFGVLLTTLLALTDSPWWWLAVAPTAAAAMTAATRPWLLAHRAVLLQSADGHPARGAPTSG